MQGKQKRWFKRWFLIELETGEVLLETSDRQSVLDTAFLLQRYTDSMTFIIDGVKEYEL